MPIPVQLSLPVSHWTSVLEDIAVKVRIGIHAHEQIAPQPLLVSVQMRCHARGRQFGRTLAQCIDYDPVRAFVLSWQDRPQVELLEQLAHELLDCIFAMPLVDQATLRIVKTAVFRETAQAGIEVTMTRLDWAAE